MNVDSLLYFLTASVALSLAPGPDNLFVVAQGVSRGRRPAVAAAWGMCSGITVHTTAAALGLSALLYSSSLAFQVVKYAGALYLLYLAYAALRDSGTPLTAAGSTIVPLTALFRRGFFMNVLNPKVALFFVAFLPQFVAPDAGDAGLQMFALGLIFMAQAAVVFTIIAVGAGAVGHYLLQRPGAARALSWMAAAVFASLALRLALVRR